MNRHRRAVLAASSIAVVAAIFGVSRGADYASSNSVDTEAHRGALLVDQELPPSPTSFVLIAASTTLTVDDARFRAALQTVLAPLASNRSVSGVSPPYGADGTINRQLVSTDRHHALTVIRLVNGGTQTYRDVRATLVSSTLQLTATGAPAVNADYNRVTEADASRGEDLSIPLSLILLFVIFGSVVAACLPVVMALASTLGGLAVLVVLTRFMNVDSSASNVAIFLGLGLGIDYSLFVTSRFREELARTRDVEEALRVAYDTAGTAIAVSGLTVAIGFGGLLFFGPQTWLFPFGLATMTVVLLSIVAAVTLLPVLLARCAPIIDRGRLWRRRERPPEQGLWHRLAMAVMRHPLAVLAPSLVVLLVPVVAFTQLQTGTDHLNDLPASAESRQGVELLRAQFPQTSQMTVPVVVHWSSGPVLTMPRTAALAALTSRLSSLQGVLAVTTTVGTDIAVVNVTSVDAERSVAARNLVAAIRARDSVAGAEVFVTGSTAGDVDFVGYIYSRLPYVVGFVVVATYVLLFCLFGSVVLPLKAVATNLLSITASFGALTWVFQQGHLSGLLNFTPGPIDPVLPVLLFCVLFGLSMDYEVFLLSRIREEYQRTGDTRRAVAIGLERNGRLVSGAAAIMIVVTACFGTADVAVVKIVGLGAALAILVDATIVRGLVVPAVMCLMGRANWWAPRSLLAVRARFTIAEPAGHGPRRATPQSATE